MSEYGEPWRVVRTEDKQGAFPEKRFTLWSDTHGGNQGEIRNPWLPYSESEELAERLVACVNACAGVPTEDLAVLGASLNGAREAAKRLSEGLPSIDPLLRGVPEKRIDAMIEVSRIMEEAAIEHEKRFPAVEDNP